MARYRKIDPRIWGDEKFGQLSKPQPNAQTLWFYLLTGPHTDSCPGLYQIGEMAIAENLGWTVKGLRKAFAELFTKGMVKADFKARVVMIPNVKKYDAPDNPNVVKKWGKDFDEIPECSLKTEYFHMLKGFIEGFGEGFAKAFKEGFGKWLDKPLKEEEERKKVTQRKKEEEEFQNQNQNQNQGLSATIPKPEEELYINPKNDFLKFGEFQNVLLTHDQFEKLTHEYTEQRSKEMIEILSSAMASNSKLQKKYTDHYATIKTWERSGYMTPKNGGGKYLL